MDESQAAPAPEAPAPDTQVSEAPTERYGVVGGAAELITHPTQWFRGMPKEGGYGIPMLRVALFTFFGSVIALLYEFAGMGPYAQFGGVSAAAKGLVMGPLMGLASSFVGAAILHGLCKLIGGKASFQASYRLVASMSVLSPISALLSPMPFSFVVMQLYALYLTVAGVTGVHGVRAGAAWLVFGIVTAFVLVVGFMAQSMARNMAPPTSAAPGELPPPAEGSLTPEQVRAMEEAMKQMEKEK